MEFICIYIYYYIIYRENYGHIWTLDKSREDISKYKLSREDTYIIYIQKYLSVSRNIHKYPSVSYIYMDMCGVKNMKLGTRWTRWTRGEVVKKNGRGNMNSPRKQRIQKIQHDMNMT